MGPGDLSQSDLSQILRFVAQAIESRPSQQAAPDLEHRRLETIQRLLAGERVDASLLNYGLRGFHAGFVVSGLEADLSLSDLRHRLNSRVLLARPVKGTTWGWLGGDDRGLRGDLELLLARKWPEGAVLACGEPSEGLGGWCLTHRQALAALPIAQAGPTPAIHYRDVALLATALHDDLLSSCLRRSFLDPLEEERDQGLAAKDTLRSYFRAGRNGSSAAALLGVNRATVRNRLTAIEGRLGRSLDAVSVEMQVALELDRFSQTRFSASQQDGNDNGRCPSQIGNA